jgi:20S proteasome subunit beta 3
VQQTLFARFKFRHNLYKLREERDMEPETFAHLVSNILYGHRFGSYFCQPVIVGLSKEGKPYLCGMDSIGARETAKDFMVGGTAPEGLMGVCESFWREGMVCVSFWLLTRLFGIVCSS